MSAPVHVSRRMERGILLLFLAAAAVVALAFLLNPVRRIVGILGGRTSVDLLTVAEVPRDAAGGGVMIESATFETAFVVAAGLSDPARWLIALGVGFAALTAAAVAGTILFFVLLLMWRRPFHRSLITATQIAGCALLIGSVLAGGLGGLGRMMAADELNPLTDDIFVVGFSFDPIPVFAGLIVLALSFVFDRGTRLQRDTEGLV